MDAPASIQTPTHHSVCAGEMHWPRSCESGRPQPRRRTRSHPIGPLVTTQRTVLVVDDDRLLCDLLTELLTEAGYTVQCADDGEAAWAELQRSSPDLVLSDIKMPRLGGIDLASRLVSGGYMTPIILMSAGHHDWTGVSAHFFRKPFNFDHLLAAIAAVLEPPTPRRSSATA
jgi:DNA-binding response OmpR family regulator